MTRKAASTHANTAAYYSRRLAFQGFATACAIPLGFLLAGVFDGGVMGQLVRAALELAFA